MMRPTALGTLAAVLLSLHLRVPGGEEAGKPIPEADQFFELKVRPLLAEKCHRCHRGEKPKANLRLDSRDAILRGGDSGPAVLPGNPAGSRMIQAVRQEGKLKMPPSRKLAAEEIASLTRWVAMGAPWPAEKGSPGSAALDREFKITDQDRAWWAFRPVERPRVPEVKRPEWVANPIDAFILEALEAKGLDPGPPASRRELIRRAHFDLLGVPPASAEVEAFEASQAPDAYARLLDRLLARPAYGERWGRYWLDVVRYAQTNGYERDDEKPFAWRYRDYVVRSLNEDKPYDRFILEQLAGDELDEPSAETLTATGFYRLGVWDDEPDDARMAEYDGLDDIVRTTSSAFLGLSLGCARCHHHMFDPIPQEDYYRFLSFFRNVRAYEAPRFALDSAVLSPLAPAAEVARWREERDARIRALEAKVEAVIAPVRKRLFEERLAALPEAERNAHALSASARGPGETKLAEEASRKASPKPEEVERALDEEGRGAKKKLDAELKRERETPPPFEWALAVRERGPEPPRTHVLIRGSAAQPAAEVEPAFLAVLGGGKPEPPGASAERRTSGRRRALAGWIASPKNPLAPRVLVNRLWQHHFGQGIVRTPDDFGRAGVAPTHPRLLDWLASELVAGGFKLKRLHKLIMLSSAYRMSARAREGRAVEVDPDNTLLWRQNLRRLDAEALRDAVLAVSGRLNPKVGGRGVFARLSGEVLAGQSRPGLGWEISPEEERARRSLYLFVKRTLRVPLLEMFDYGNTDQPAGVRPVTTVAPQALMLLNSDFLQAEAAALADRIRARAGGDPASQVERGYILALQRRPSAAERAIALDFLDRQRRAAEARPPALTFVPEAPRALGTTYFRLLAPPDFIAAPAGGWAPSRGSWLDRGEGILWADPQRGPHALWNGAEFSDGTIEGQVLLHRGTEHAGILIRASARGDSFAGYELHLDPENGVVALRRHEEEVRELGRAALPLAVETWIPFRLEAAGARLRASLGGRGPAIEASDPAPLAAPGRVGARAWGAALSLLELKLTAAGRETRIEAPRRAPGDEALEALALVLLNLNEFVYID